MNEQHLKRNSLSYSIWVIPSGDLLAELKKIIYNLSSVFESIIFIPHVTLLCGFVGHESRLLEKAERLARGITYFDIKFKKIEFSEDFFQTFFIRVAYNNGLKKVKDFASSQFSFYDDNSIPHLSLAYGTKELILKKDLKKTIKINFEGFTAKSIYLAYNDEINYKWKVIKEFPLSK